MLQTLARDGRYDATTIWLHWATALLVVAQWIGGQTIDWYPRGLPRVEARSVHIVLGLCLTAVLVTRIVWRATRGRSLPRVDAGVLHILAKATHHTLYLLLSIIVVLGLVLMLARNDSIFDLFKMPPLIPADHDLRESLGAWHGRVANVILILAGVHAAAALVHHFLWRDGVLARMSPHGR